MVPGVLAVVALCAIGIAAVQDTPDFSGQWPLASASELVADVAKVLVVQRTMAGSIPTLVVERRVPTMTDPERYQIGVESGMIYGKDVSGRGNGPDGITETRSSARWFGSELVIKTGSYWGDAARFTEREEAWSLDASGRLVIKVATRERVLEPKQAVFVYRRR